MHEKGKPRELSFKRKRRYFRLKGLVLLYYKHECDANGVRPDGTKATLKGGLRICAGASEAKLHGRRIIITGLNTKDRDISMYVFVKSPEDGHRWMAALRDAIQFAEATAEREAEAAARERG